MKKVLFATTAAAALSISGAAFAGGHDSGNFGLSGKTSVGYNDEIEGGIFMDTDVDMKVSKSVGEYEIGGTFEFDSDWNEGDTGATPAGTTGGEVTTAFGFDNIYLDTPIGKLTFLESNDGGSASDLFYVDRDGQADDVQNLDGLASLLWEGNVGQFDYAIDSGDIDNGVDDDWSIGMGTSLSTGGGDFDIGVGYDNNSGGSGSSATGVSLDFGVGMFDVGVSYLAGASEDTTAVVLGFDVTPELSVGAYYADNETSANEYGATLDYASGPLSIGVDIHMGEDTGGVSFDENYEIDVSYDTGAGATLYAGYDDNEVNYDGDAGSFYVGAEIDIADGITATVAYAEADEISGPEFKGGTSLFLTVKY